MKRQAIMRFPFFYYGLCWLLYIVALPFLAITSLRQKYTDSIPSRFFARSISLSFEPHFWFHACSFGEMRSLKPIINAYRDSPILVTTITHTGFSEAQKLYGDFPQIEIKYLPFEIFLPMWSKYLRSLRCFINTEAELWYMLFYITKSSNARTMLLNARISTRSFPRYKKLAIFYKRLFDYVDIVLAQSETDKTRLESIGAKNIEIFGNLKILSIPKVSAQYLKPNRLVILAASTHKGEEEMIIKAFQNLLEHTNDSPSPPLLLIAPRHPERFNEVYEIAHATFPNAFHFSTIKDDAILYATSTNDKHKSPLQSAEVVVVDELGILINLYAISDVVILGGSFVPAGGHNPLEPAFFNTRLISGEHIFNQYALFELVKNYKLISSQELSDTLQNAMALEPSAIIQTSDNKLQEILRKIGNG